jgi:hypothetical protein
MRMHMDRVRRGSVTFGLRSRVLEREAAKRPVNRIHHVKTRRCPDGDERARIFSVCWFLRGSNLGECVGGVPTVPTRLDSFGTFQANDGVTVAEARKLNGQVMLITAEEVEPLRMRL